MINRKLDTIGINKSADVVNKHNDVTNSPEMTISNKIHLNYTCLSCGSKFAKAQSLGQHGRNCIPSDKNSKIDNLDHSPWKCKHCNFR